MLDWSNHRHLPGAGNRPTHSEAHGQGRPANSVSPHPHPQSLLPGVIRAQRLNVVPNNDRADPEQILSDASGRHIAFVEAWAEGMASGVAEENLGPTWRVWSTETSHGPWHAGSDVECETAWSSRGLRSRLQRLNHSFVKNLGPATRQGSLRSQVRRLGGDLRWWGSQRDRHCIQESKAEVRPCPEGYCHAGRRGGSAYSPTGGSSSASPSRRSVSSPSPTCPP